MLWLETKTEAEAIARSERLWTPVGRDTADGGFVATCPGPEPESGHFWGDAIKELVDDPQGRLDIARRQLPLPGAFRQMALALRALIRDARKQGANFDALLKELHHFAAVSSWTLPYNEIAREPGFNVIERTPYAKLAALDLSWDAVGGDELPLLNKTDRTLMRQVWGEPQRHTTANALYHGLWLEGCRQVAAARRASMAEFEREIRAIVAPSVPQAQPRPQRSWLSRLFN